MHSGWRKNLITAAIAAFSLALTPPGHAGPVPGVETFTRRPVEFPTPPSVTVWEVGDDDYLVTFRHTPEAGSPRPSVVGTFNSWSKTDLPMEGPDKDGVYTVTARLKGGDYTYKFFAGGNYFTDPDNPNVTPDTTKNSILRIGLTALLGDAKALRGDGKVESRAFAHNQDAHQFYDVFSPRDVTIRFRTLANDVESASIVLIARDGSRTEAPMTAEGGDKLFDFHEYHLRLDPAKAAPVAYSFLARDKGTVVAFDRRFPIVLDPATIVKTPDWARKAIWYQIMVERFRDGNPKNNPEYTLGSSRTAKTTPWKSDFWAADGKILPREEFFKYDGDHSNIPDVWERLHGGDFEGVIQQLDYLKGLGVNSIYLCPVFEAGDHHKYGARSYVHADDGFGVPGEYAKSIAKENVLDPKTWTFNESDKLLLRLIKEVHKRDMRIILDGVFNHLGDQSDIFQDVVKNRQKSPYADWFDIESWEPFKHHGWAGSGQLPQFKKSETGYASQQVHDYVFAVTKRWLDPNGDGDPSDGIDGWRLDVPTEVPKPFWVEWRKHVKSVNPDAYIVGEIWDPAEDWLDGTSFDAVMNYQFAKIAFRYFGNVEKKASASEFDRELGRLRARYPHGATYVLQNLFDSHDTDRWASRLLNPDKGYDGGNGLHRGNDEYNESRPSAEVYRRVRLMATFQATYVGAPMIFYGTEQGMYGADDPQSRMPMWWDDLMPYDNADYHPEPGLRDHFRQLFHLRAANPLLAAGDVRTLLADDAKDTVAFQRFQPGTRGSIVVVLNNSNSEQQLSLPAPEPFRRAKVLFGEGAAEVRDGGKSLAVKLPPVSGLIVKIP